MRSQYIHGNWRDNIKEQGGVRYIHIIITIIFFCDNQFRSEIRDPALTLRTIEGERYKLTYGYTISLFKRLVQ